MQSWGSDSRLQVRRTDPVPGKSAVIGLVLCAMGIQRQEACHKATELSSLQMGVRVDQKGHADWDYHTVGAGLGVRQAQGGIKRTASTKEPETLLSRRQYLYGASFLVALQGEARLVADVRCALSEPVWPVFLGRKCCIPSEPVHAGIGEHSNLQAALGSVPFVNHDTQELGGYLDLDAFLELAPGDVPPTGALLVYDVPRTLTNPSHGPRWVVPSTVRVPLAPRVFHKAGTGGRGGVNYAGTQWREVRKKRLAFDNYLCIFCKCPAEDVHHVTYERVGGEEIVDLRSLCKTCHDACTQLEYGSGMTSTRIDPSDPSSREAILSQIGKLLSQRRMARRKAIREMASLDFLDNAPDSGTL